MISLVASRTPGCSHAFLRETITVKSSDTLPDRYYPYASPALFTSKLSLYRCLWLSFAESASLVKPSPVIIQSGALNPLPLTF